MACQLNVSYPDFACLSYPDFACQIPTNLVAALQTRAIVNTYTSQLHMANSNKYKVFMLHFSRFCCN